MEEVKRYAEMKDSGVEWIGEIPRHWHIDKLKRLVSTPLQYGANESGIPYGEFTFQVQGHKLTA